MTTNLNSQFGMRNGSPHRGLDYRTISESPDGKVPLQARNGTLECITDGTAGYRGYGNVGNVWHQCNGQNQIREQYSHLDSCDAASGSMVTDNTGHSEGPHLHYEIIINNVAVDPEEAFAEEDLCDPATQEKLIASAQNKLNGLAGKPGTPAGPNPKSPQNTQYVPPGSPSTTIPDGQGGTITIPEGGGYVIITDQDGRVHIEPMDSGYPPTGPGIPQGTPPDLTPGTETNNEVTGCATDTWTAMVNQSVLQTRREMVANQVYIGKPDSVMAYSCLAEHMTAVREDLGPIFSETKRWVNVEVDLMPKIVTLNKELGEYSLDGAITNVALFPYESWMRGNFAYGLYEGVTGHEEGGGGGEDHDDAHDQSYTPCGAMKDVWKIAKCKNVDEEQMFYKFEDLINTDPRKNPKGYECNATGITQAQIDTAKGKEVKFDKVDSYLDLLYPGEGGTCAPAVKTGVTVIRQKLGEDGRISTEETYPDALCLTIGCSYDKEDGKCVVK